MSDRDEQRPERSSGDRPAWKKPDSARGERRSRPDSDRGPRSRSDSARQERPNRAGDDRNRPDRPSWQTRVERPRDENRVKSPMIPDEITEKDLDLLVRVQMKTLSPENAERVARHLAMVNLLIDDDPELAHRHALAAADRAGRIGVVRETLGVTAYTIGDFALALRELQAHRRITGSNDQLPLMVDSERGLGRAERALELGRSVPRDQLTPDVRVNLAIAISGARLDLGQNDLALAELEIAELNPERVFEYSPHLFRAYAHTLEILNRTKDAEHWHNLADRALAAIQAKSAPAEDVVTIVEEIVIPEPYQSKDSGPKTWGASSRALEQRGGDRPYGDRPRRDDSRDERPRREGSRDERPRRDDSRDDRPRRDSPRDGGSQPWKPRSPRD